MDACRQLLKKRPWCDLTTSTRGIQKSVSLKTLHNRFLQGRAMADRLRRDKRLRAQMVRTVSASLTAGATPEQTAEDAVDVFLQWGRKAMKAKVTRK